MIKSPFIGILIVFIGIIGILLLFYMYKNDNQAIISIENSYSGKIVGPFEGKVRYINIISNEKIDCLNHGFYLYFEGIKNEDFVIVTDSIRNSFGNISENIVGYRFRFERLMECKNKIENVRTFLIASAPVIIGDEE